MLKKIVFAASLLLNCAQACDGMPEGAMCGSFSMFHPIETAVNEAELRQTYHPQFEGLIEIAWRSSSTQITQGSLAELKVNAARKDALDDVKVILDTLLSAVTQYSYQLSGFQTFMSKTLGHIASCSTDIHAVHHFLSGVKHTVTLTNLDYKD